MMLADNGDEISYHLWMRSSISKTNVTMVNAAAVIDSGFRGEIGLALQNVWDEDWVISKGDRLVQVCHPNLASFGIECVESLPDNSIRGSGGFGSTGSSGALTTSVRAMQLSNNQLVPYSPEKQEEIDKVEASIPDPQDPETELIQEKLCSKAVDLCRMKNYVGDYFILEHPIESPIWSLPNTIQLAGEPGVYSILFEGLKTQLLTNAPFLMPAADSCYDKLKGRQGAEAVSKRIADLIENAEKDPKGDRCPF